MPRCAASPKSRNALMLNRTLLGKSGSQGAAGIGVALRRARAHLQANIAAATRRQLPGTDVGTGFRARHADSRMGREHRPERVGLRAFLGHPVRRLQQPVECRQSESGAGRWTG
jgi:hypothetical protein